MFGELLTVVSGFIEKSLDRKRENKENMMRIGQLVEKRMYNFCNEVKTLDQNESFKDFSLTIDDKIELLEEGLDLMGYTLHAIKESEIFAVSTKQFRREIDKYLGYVKDRENKLEDEDFYDDEYEIYLEIMDIVKFCDDWSDFLYSRTKG